MTSLQPVGWKLVLAAFLVLTTAGLSDLIGQSVVLFLNRVPPRRFLLCLLSGTLLFMGSATSWIVSLWVLGYGLGLELGFWRSFVLVGLAHLPLVLGWTVLLPHFGRLLFHGLRAWVFFNLVAEVGVVTGAPLWKAVFACAPGWLVHFSLTHLELLRLERFQAALWRLLSGSDGKP